MSKKRRLELEKALTMAVATINVLNTMAPLGVQYVEMTKDIARHTKIDRQVAEFTELVIENGGRLLDNMLFTKAEAFTDPVTGVVTGETVTSGSQNIKSGGTANITTINSGGTQYLSSGGLANNTTINSVGTQHVSSGGIANSTTINSIGYQYVSNGGVASSTTINYAGTQFISSGGLAIPLSTQALCSGCVLVVLHLTLSKVAAPVSIPMLLAVTTKL